MNLNSRLHNLATKIWKIDNFIRSQARVDLIGEQS